MLNDSTIITLKINKGAVSLPFAYTIQIANENHFFSPTLSEDEEFELFELLISEYYNAHDLDMESLETKELMRDFYLADELLSEEDKDAINELFEHLEVLSQAMKESGENVSFEIDEEDEELLHIVCPVVVDFESLPEEVIVDEDTDISDINKDIYSDLENTINNGHVGEVENINAEIEVWSYLSALKVVTGIYPALLHEIELKAMGLQLSDKLDAIAMLVSTMDVLLFEVNWQDKIRYADLRGYLFNIHRNSLDILDHYILNSPNIDKYEVGIKNLHKYFTKLEMNKSGDASSPLSPSEQYMLLIIESLSIVGSIEEEDMD